MKVYLPEPEAFSSWALSALESAYGLAGKPDEAGILLVRVGTRVDPPMLDRAPNLRLVVSATTGDDHIDIEECRRRRIDIVTLKGETGFLVGLPNTAEHAFALLLALYRRLPAACRDVLRGAWQQAPYRGRTLKGRTFGIAGYGRLGRIAGEIAKGFGMKVLAYDPQPRGRTEPAVALVDTLEALAGAVDVLSLHADLNESSVNMVNAVVLEAMPESAVLVNTARGQLVDEAALLEALRNGSISGAALDVIRNEDSFGEGNALLEYARDHDNLLLTPHIGGQTSEAVEAADKYIVSKIERWCASYAG